ncbi:MAG: exopolyphosphatase/pppGpp-phosphohydrolase [Cyclobacteriaceae bacterium]|jgi:exopolyphosphatase/pppGpp-phosphohydrolase
MIIGGFALSSTLASLQTFTDSFTEFPTPSELQIELAPGTYELFELTTQIKSEKKIEAEYIVSEIEENPKVIEITLGTDRGEKSKVSTYIINNKKIRGIGRFEIQVKQSVKIISKVNAQGIDGLAYRLDTATNLFYVIMKPGIILLISIGAFIISVVALLLIRDQT